MNNEKEVTVTTQLTSKYWKLFSAIGLMLLISSFVSMWLNIGIQSAIPFIFGLIFYIYGRIGAWWNHG